MQSIITTHIVFFIPNNAHASHCLCYLPITLSADLWQGKFNGSIRTCRNLMEFACNIASGNYAISLAAQNVCLSSDDLLKV